MTENMLESRLIGIMTDRPSRQGKTQTLLIDTAQAEGIELGGSTTAEVLALGTATLDVARGFKNMGININLDHIAPDSISRITEKYDIDLQKTKNL